MLLIDSFEPTDIQNLLAQTTEVIRTSLNQANLADYFWTACDGHTIQIERKQWAELLGEFDDIEEQLRKEMDNADEMGLLIEGIMRPHPLGCEALRAVGNKLLSQHISKRPYAMAMAWLWRIDKMGITPYFTFDWKASAMAIGAYYNNSQDSEHTTLRRYVKDKAPAWVPDIHVQNLINLRGVNLGPVRAQSLIDVFITYWDVISQEPDVLATVEGIGIKTARDIIKATGREL